MATVTLFCTGDSWKYVGIDPKYPKNFDTSIGAVIAKGNRISGIEAKE